MPLASTRAELDAMRAQTVEWLSLIHICSAAGSRIETDRLGVDVLVTSTQKALALPPEMCIRDSCYSSRDLYNWKDEGIALKVVEGDNSHPIAKGCILERPKVVLSLIHISTIQNSAAWRVVLEFSARKVGPKV